MSSKTCKEDYRELTKKDGKGFIIKEIKGYLHKGRKYPTTYINFTYKLIGRKVKIELIK